jgi:hypothetical protein
MEYSITSTAMTVRLAVLAGVNDIAVLVALATLSVAMITLGGLDEWLSAFARPVQKSDTRCRRLQALTRSAAAIDPISIPRVVKHSPFGLATGLFGVQWAIMLATFTEAVASSNTPPPTWLTVLFVGLAIVDSGFPIVAWLNRRCNSYARVDAAYSVLSLTAKFFFMQTILFGFQNYDADRRAG